MTPAMRQRLRAGAIGCVLGTVTLLATAVVVLIVVAAVPDGPALLLSATAAVLPAIFYAGVALRLDHYETEPLRTVLACFAWGAIGAILLSIIGSLIFQQMVQDALGVEAAEALSLVVGAPVIEESFKGIALLAVLFVARDEFDSSLDGLVYGALVGVGFAMTENILYFGQTYIQEGIGSFGVLVAARAVLGGLGHPAYTAVTGAAIGWARGRYGKGVARFIVPILGWAVAVGLHASWNGGLILTSASLGEDSSLLEVVAVQTLLVIVPAVLVLWAIARMSSRAELEILRTELQHEVRRGTLTEGEFLTITDTQQRKAALREAKERGGRRLRGVHLAFFHTAGDLAFRQHHQRQGEPAKPIHSSQDDADRKRLAVLRYEMRTVGLLPPGER